MHVESDWSSSEALPVDVFVGDCAVVALPLGHSVSDDIGAPLLASLLGATPPVRVLLRTGYSVAHGAFPDDWPALRVDGAQWLLDHGVRLWGSDAPSADRRESKTLPVHHAMFSGGAYLLENLALDHVAPGRYELLAQPLAVHGADAAPVRALLRVTIKKRVSALRPSSCPANRWPNTAEARPLRLSHKNALSRVTFRRNPSSLGLHTSRRW